MSHFGTKTALSIAVATIAYAGFAADTAKADHRYRRGYSSYSYRSSSYGSCYTPRRSYYAAPRAVYRSQSRGHSRGYGRGHDSFRSRRHRSSGFGFSFSFGRNRHNDRSHHRSRSSHRRRGFFR